MEKNCQSFCGFGKKSSKLDGAISPNMVFFYLSTIRNDFERDERDIFKNISQYIGEEFDLDYENETILYNDMAVLDAYNLDDVNNIDLSRYSILMINKNMYPNYDFKLIQKEFPLDLAIDDNNQEKVIMGTHLLCITNYKDCLKRKAKTL